MNSAGDKRKWDGRRNMRITDLKEMQLATLNFEP